MPFRLDSNRGYLELEATALPTRHNHCPLKTRHLLHQRMPHLEHFIFVEHSRHLSFAGILKQPDLTSDLLQLLQGLFALLA